MLGHLRMPHLFRGPRHHLHMTEVPRILEVGLLAPPVFAVLGSMIGGFTYALLGFAVGIATCALLTISATALTDDE